MLKYFVKVRSIEPVTHVVIRIITEKPYLLNFIPGQVAEISINKSEWLDEKHRFTLTCLPENNYLEFTIKTDPLQEGITNALLKLEKNDELIIHDIF